MSRIAARREFLFQMAEVAALGLGCSARGAAAIEPFRRNGSPEFRFSLAAYSYRELFQRQGLTLADFVNDCAAMGLDGAELTSYYLPTPIDDESLCRLKQQCFLLGLDVSGTAIRSDFGLPRGAERDAQIAEVQTWVDRASLMGAPVIRIFAGLPHDGVAPQEQHALVVQGIEQCCEYAGKRGVFLALENHGGPTTTPQGMLAIVRDVQSPWFGVNMDTGNFYSDDPYAELQQIAPYAVNVQIKVVTSDKGRQRKKPTDMKRLAAMLLAEAYRGYIVLEYEEPGDPRVECPRYLASIREAFA